MKIPSLLLLLAAVLALAGCSSTPAKVDSGAIRARTFSFVNTGAKPAPAYADNRQVIHPMIQFAIEASLTRHGLTRLPVGGDITVGYLLIVGNNATTASISDYFGYGEDAAGLQDKAHKAYTGSKNPNYFEAGTLVIDLIDSKTFKLLKRGHGTRPILKNLSEDARAARIQEVVEEILQDLHITQ